MHIDKALSLAASGSGMFGVPSTLPYKYTGGHIHLSPRVVDTVSKYFDQNDCFLAVETENGGPETLVPGEQDLQVVDQYS